jgi:hypothetical protein
MPYSSLSGFIDACKRHPEKVQVQYDAARNARDHYKLETEDDLVKFIGNYGLVNTVPGIKEIWRLNPDPDKENNPQYVDDYLCLVNRSGCYIAIININYWYGKVIDKWILKSFKPPDPSEFDRFRPSPYQLTDYKFVTKG